jgi:pimeloyl-ACP methyl ester carboxylesterase
VATTVVLLHGWPGTARVYRLVNALLPEHMPVIAPDLLGFGSAFTGPVALEDITAEAHARRLLDAIDGPLVVAGYDVGSRIAQAMARMAPERITGLVATPAFPAMLRYAAAPAMAAHYWYQHFHRLPLSTELLDGRREAVHAYLTHIWSTWGNRDLTSDAEFETLIDAYARPGALAASIAWYSANPSGGSQAAITVPTIVLWGDSDPLFPAAWAEAVPESFTDARLRILPGAGHFLPLEAPEPFAAAIEGLL